MSRTALGESLLKACRLSIELNGLLVDLAEQVARQNAVPAVATGSPTVPQPTVVFVYRFAFVGGRWDRLRLELERDRDWPGRVHAIDLDVGTYHRVRLDVEGGPVVFYRHDSLSETEALQLILDRYHQPKPRPAGTAVLVGGPRDRGSTDAVAYNAGHEGPRYVLVKLRDEAFFLWDQLSVREGLDRVLEHYAPGNSPATEANGSG